MGPAYWDIWSVATSRNSIFTFDKPRWRYQSTTTPHNDAYTSQSFQLVRNEKRIFVEAKKYSGKLHRQQNADFF